MLNERELTKKELEKREKAMMDLKANKRSFVKRYGKDAEAVMYGRATNIAKKQTENMNKEKLRELIKSSLQGPVKEIDVEVGADRYEGEQNLSQASAMLDDLEAKMKSHDWFYMMSDDPRRYQEGRSREQEIRSLIADLEKIGYGKDAKDLYNSVEPYSKAFPGANHKLSEKKGKDMDGDGDIDSQDYLAARDAAIKKAKGEMKEDMDLGHQDNEPHMLKGDLYRIGKYAMELYQMVEEFEGKGEVDFPHWWQAKIINAKDALVGAKHYLDFETKEPEIDAMVGAIDKADALDNVGVDQPVFEDEVGETDKLAAAIQNALNKNKSAEDQENIKQARKAMNDGNIEAAKKILQPYLEEGNLGHNELASLEPEGRFWIVTYRTMDGKKEKVFTDEDEARAFMNTTLEEGLPKGFWKKEIPGGMDESYDTLVKKIEDQGKSAKAAKAIAGAVAAYKAKGGGKGPTAKQKK